MSTTYPVVRNRPVAKFRYKGNHSKPVRREVILTDITRGCLTGYEIREGNTTRPLGKKVIKSYNRDEIMGLERFPISTIS
jgi:hypothetical protein